MDCSISGSSIRDHQSQRLVILVRIDFNLQYPLAMGKRVQGGTELHFDVCEGSWECYRQKGGEPGAGEGEGLV